MKNNITELVFILDRSGSMSGLEGDTIGGFNSLIEKQRRQDGECYVSTVLFDNVSEVLHDRVRLSEIRKMTEDDYTVREDVPEHTMFVIMTDGMENASRKYSSREVKRMIEKEKKKYGWEFLFIGANIDSVETAGHFGIGADRSANYHADGKGTAVVFEAVADTVSCMRKSRPITADWSGKINEDYNSR